MENRKFVKEFEKMQRRTERRALIRSVRERVLEWFGRREDGPMAEAKENK
ncbi:hypothetical protein [Thioalkalivibrio sp. ALE19]|nr:hypothetical protein [Thioalkalivibrio sp. ALE19]